MTSTERQFDPAAHRLAPQRWFEDFVVGERYLLPSRTMTEANFAAFQTVSADNHPIHYDAEFCRLRGLPGPLAHGFQILCFTAAGASRFPHELSDALMGFVEQSCKFLRPVFAGDTLYPALEIVELVEQHSTGLIVMRATIHNHKCELVLSGEHRYLVRKRHGA